MNGLLEKGSYVAQYGETGALIAMDEYLIEQIPTGFKIQSDNVIFGQNGFRQCAEMLVDDQWLMRKLRVVVEEKNIELNADIDNGSFRIKQSQAQTETTKLIPLQLNQYFLIYNGALVMPLIWLRGFNSEYFEKVQFQLLPVGLAEVMQIKQSNTSDIRKFSVNIQVMDFTDFIHITTDHTGRTLLYESALSKLIIKPQLPC